MSETYHDGHRLLQDRFDTRRLADRIDGRLVDDGIDADDRAFIESLDMFFLATADDRGYPNCSYKGGEPGFVRVLDEHTVAFPSYDGNGMYLSTGNVLVNPNVGMLFINLERGRRLRLNGVASIDEHDELMEHYPEAQFIVCAGMRGLPELSPLHTQVPARGALSLRPQGGLPDAGARLEAIGTGKRRPARRRSGTKGNVSPLVTAAQRL